MNIGIISFIYSKVEYDNNSAEKYEFTKYTIQEFTISAQINSIIPILKKTKSFYLFSTFDIPFSN